MRSFPALPEWVSLEHQVAQILTEQEIHGWYFDQRSARDLELHLRRELREITEVLERRYPFVAGSEFTPKRNNRNKGYVIGATFQRLKPLLPASRDHIAWILTNFDNFDPNGSLTATGKMVIDETSLKNHGTGLALQFLRILEITKLLGMISEGVNAWLKLCTSANRLHHHCSVATATHRVAHRSPNLGQVPSDERARKLFMATPGQVMVGADLSGIELRMLSHYLARYDGGRYADILLNGDIHQVNADKIGVSRKLVKNISYAFLYGAGDVKIGLTYDKLLSPKQAKQKGAEIRAAYVAAIDGLSDLLDAIQNASNRGFVKSIDGRKIILDSPHKALNYLLQSGAGVIAKRWMVLAHDNPFCCSQLAFVHDELQYECTPEHAEDLRFHLEWSAVRAGEYYNLRVPIAAEGKIGDTWADVH
jgi:DNA polymerase I-like protein with 3'-5' exonuclease and polymerase domains